MHDFKMLLKQAKTLVIFKSLHQKPVFEKYLKAIEACEYGSSDEAIEKFMEKFKKKGEKYPGTEFFEWHHYLTGSCLMGRKSFVRNHGLDLDALYTVDEFIALCEDDYGGEIIRQLKKRWEDEVV